jgi:hypothetical protein
MVGAMRESGEVEVRCGGGSDRVGWRRGGKVENFGSPPTIWGFYQKSRLGHFCHQLLASDDILIQPLFMECFRSQ